VAPDDTDLQGVIAGRDELPEAIKTATLALVALQRT